MYNLHNNTYNFNCITHANDMGYHVGRTLLVLSLCYELA
jgi:hypothetical protein